MCYQKELAKSNLAGVLRYLDACKKQSGSFNTSLCLDAGDACILLGFDQLKSEFESRLIVETSPSFLEKIWSSISLKRVKKKPWKLSFVEQLEKSHPQLDDDHVRESVRRMFPEFTPCLDGEFEAVSKTVSSEFEIECFALTQAVLGFFEEAMKTSERINERHRISNVQFVMAIEHFRHDRISEGEAILSLIPTELSDFGAVQFALGISRRTPWLDYPYPDY